MKGFKSIEELSLKSCYYFLLSEENKKHPLYSAIVERYQEMLQDLEKQDSSDYAACKNIENYNAYIKKFSDNSIAPYYKAKHINEAKNAIEGLFWDAHKGSIGGCKEYLSRYPKGKYVNIANSRIGSSKKTKWLVLGIVLILLVITFFIGYKPVNSLSVSESSLSFGKWGGTENVHISTNVSSNAVDVRCSGAGFDTEEDYGSDLKVTAGANEGDSRTGTVKVTAYATLYGMRIGEGKSITTNLSQESGLATKLSLSTSVINATKWGGECQVTVSSDGVSEEMINSHVNWISVEKIERGKYKFVINKNPNDSRQGEITIESGNIKKKINIFQASGLANKFAINKSSIKVSPSSSSSYVNVNTDGVSWDVSSHPSWVNIIKYDNYFKVEIEDNSSDSPRSGRIVVRSNNGHSQYVSVSQGGNGSYITINGNSSISRTYSSSGTTEIFNVNTDADSWTVWGTPSWCSVENKTSTSFKLRVNGNNSSVSRSDYMEVRTNNGKSARLDISQNANNYLKVDGYTSTRNSHFSENGGKETFSVSTNASSYEVVLLPSWCTVESKNSSSFTIRCERNNSRSERSDYFKVKAAGMEIRINVKQNGASGPSAVINSVTVDHNVFNGMVKGMKINIKFDTEGMLNKRVTATALFYYGDNVTPLNNGYGGQVSVSHTDTVLTRLVNYN